MPYPSYFTEELPSQEEDLSSNTIRAKCGTVWKVISQADEDCGRFSQQNILRETPGPTSFAKRLVQKRSYMSAFSILIDDFIIEHIRKCTEAQGRRVLKNDNYKVSREEILAVIGIMYARGILGKNQSIDHLWSRKWGPPFFRDTMPRHKFKELMRFIRFDIRTIRSEHLRTDKFAYISEV